MDAWAEDPDKLFCPISSFVYNLRKPKYVFKPELSITILQDTLGPVIALHFHIIAEV